MKKKTKPKKENKQIVEVHIYIHQTPNYTPPSTPQYPHNPLGIGGPWVCN